jgi:hypothetical protein
MFQDLFLLQLLKTKEKYRITQKKADAFPHNKKLIEKYLSYLPFNITSGQKQALDDILSDLTKPHADTSLITRRCGFGKKLLLRLLRRWWSRRIKNSRCLWLRTRYSRTNTTTFTSFYEEFEEGVGF